MSDNVIVIYLWRCIHTSSTRLSAHLSFRSPLLWPPVLLSTSLMATCLSVHLSYGHLSFCPPLFWPPVFLSTSLMATCLSVYIICPPVLSPFRSLSSHLAFCLTGTAACPPACLYVCCPHGCLFTCILYMSKWLSVCCLPVHVSHPVPKIKKQL